MEAAYDAAWARLIERYDRPRHVVNSLLESFINLPIAKSTNVGILRKISDGANEIVRGFDAVGQTGRDCWVIHLLLAKIDSESRRKWVDFSRDVTSLRIEDLFGFLDARCEEFELSHHEPTTASYGQNTRGAARSFVSAGQSFKCVQCRSDDHSLYDCGHFLGLSVEQRHAFVKEKRLCFNFLKPDHVFARCESKYRCRHCHGKHHSLIHLQVSSSQPVVTQSQPSVSMTVQDEQDQNVSLVSMSTIALAPAERLDSRPPSQIRGTLPTALVHVLNASGTYTVCRVLLDTGSELSYISERCIKELGIMRSPSRILESGISSVKAETTRGLSILNLKSRVSQDELIVTAHVLVKITSSLPRNNIDTAALKIFDGLP
ncbi:uncharacterized protein [Drosophila takahashii]|uniref:uncharacterized protein n=1 Tax=Drosophila takahashii TaxID=29030 RepID=UPI00389949CC